MYRRLSKSDSTFKPVVVTIFDVKKKAHPNPTDYMA